MKQMEATVREWGNSLGIILPKEFTKNENIKPGDKVKVIVLSNKNSLNAVFGSLQGKMKRTSQQIKDELRKEWSKY